MSKDKKIVGFQLSKDQAAKPEQHAALETFRSGKRVTTSELLRRAITDWFAKQGQD